jgi:hypothetical protein
MALYYIAIDSDCYTKFDTYKEALKHASECCADGDGRQTVYASTAIVEKEKPPVKITRTYFDWDVNTSTIGLDSL